MALTAAQIESSAPNAWTGKSTSLVYQSEATVIAFLAARGKTSYAARTAAQQVEDMIIVTEAVEAELAGLVRGAPIRKDQGLLFPATGAYTNAGALLDPDTAPQGLMDGIALLCEEQAGGTFLSSAAQRGVRRIDVEGTEIEFFRDSDLSRIKDSHPDAWRRIAEAIPTARL